MQRERESLNSHLKFCIEIASVNFGFYRTSLRSSMKSSFWIKVVIWL